MKKSILSLLILSCFFSNNCLGAFTGGDNSPGVPDKEYVTCNTCKAPTTAYQGIIEDENGYNVCQKCNPETELFIDGTGCVKKLDMTSYDRKSMRDCWMAENSAQYNCCIQLGKTYLDEYKKKTNKDTNKSNHFNCCLLNGNWNNNSCTDGDGNIINLSDVEKKSLSTKKFSSNGGAFHAPLILSSFPRRRVSSAPQVKYNLYYPHLVHNISNNLTKKITGFFCKNV